MGSPAATKVFLVTANIASCFDNPKAMLNPWLDEFFKVIREKKPQFVALHCQEVGGKNYETCMENVQEFLRNIHNRIAMLHYTRSRIFIDEEFSSAEKFTALGNLYFIRHDVQNIQMWNFQEKSFVEVEGKEEFVGDIEDVPLKEKSKFPQEFFPECKWSRKGFLRTRWCLNGTLLDLVNIHLFHDASNFIAMEKYPSVYTLNRKRAMEHTLDRFHNDELENVPIFLFGDFNFRLDTGSVVQTLTENCEVPEELEVLGELTRQFRDKKEEKSVLSVSKKAFSHADHSSIFLKDNGKWLRPFDKELGEFGPRLQEFPINFPPSYPFEEGAESQNIDAENGGLYMKTRCPSWCDRVILSQSAKELIDTVNKEIDYNIIGLNTRMGDHKPVGLCVNLPAWKGIVRCCPANGHCRNFVHDLSNNCFRVGAWCRCQAYPMCPSACNPVPTLPVQPHAQVTNVEPIPSKGNPSDLLLKNLLKLNVKAHKDCNVCGDTKFGGWGNDPLLKRVHSDPIKVRNYCERQKIERAIPIHSNLIHSHSLDAGHKSSTKLRLRSSSSRLISHHSSSSEEWFEEVPPSEDEKHLLEKSLSSSSVDLGTSGKSEALLGMERNAQVSSSYIEDDGSPASTEEILRSPNFVQQQNSLNNLLITDNCSGSTDCQKLDPDYYKSDIKSVSNLSYQTDCSSIRISDTQSNVLTTSNIKVENVDCSAVDKNSVPLVGRGEQTLGNRYNCFCLDECCSVDKCCDPCCSIS